MFSSFHSDITNSYTTEVERDSATIDCYLEVSFLMPLSVDVWDPERSTPDPDGLPDTAIVPYIQHLNANGIQTLQSCAGYVRDNGLRDSGCVWFVADSFSPDDAVESGEFERVARLYHPERAWEVVFPGLAESEAALEAAMAALFHALGISGGWA